MGDAQSRPKRTSTHKWVHEWHREWAHEWTHECAYEIAHESTQPTLMSLFQASRTPTKAPTKRPTKASTEVPTKTSSQVVEVHLFCFHLFCSSASTASNTELSEFFCPHQAPRRELSEFLSAFYLCAQANSPSLPQNSVSSLFRNSTLETVFRPFPSITTTVARGLLQGRHLQLPIGWGVGEELTES